MSWTLLLACVAAVVPLVVNSAPSGGSDSSHGRDLGQLMAEPDRSAKASNLHGSLMRSNSYQAGISNSGPGSDHDHDNDHVPTFRSVEELCEWLCRR